MVGETLLLCWLRFASCEFARSEIFVEICFSLRVFAFCEILRPPLNCSACLPCVNCKFCIVLTIISKYLIHDVSVHYQFMLIKV